MIYIFRGNRHVSSSKNVLMESVNYLFFHEEKHYLIFEGNLKTLTDFE